jgi:S-DNA-T family DNA segregation ATPase FtsK/SpoIIIE
MDSRVILDTPGAEKLLGRGDMLYGASDIPKPLRVQGCYVSEKEITALVDFIKSKKTANYDDSQILGQPVAVPGSKTGNITVGSSESHDPMFDQAVKLVQETGKASASLMQRRLKFGYARAARVLDEMEEAGYIGPSNGAKAREIYMQHSTGETSGEQ